MDRDAWIEAVRRQQESPLEPEPVNLEAPRPDVVLTFRDASGREWLAAAFLGELEYRSHSVTIDGVTRGQGPASETRSIHDSEELGLKLTDFKVVERQ